MKKRFLFLLLVLSALGVFPQNSEDVLPLPDTLVGRLKEFRKTDVGRAEALDAVILYYVEEQRVLEAQPYIKDLSELSEELKDNYWKALSLYYKSLCAYVSYNFSEFLFLINESLEITETLRETKRTQLLLTRICLIKSGYYIWINQFPECQNYIERGLEIAENNGFDNLQCKLQNNLGALLNSLGKDEDAIAKFKELSKNEELNLVVLNSLAMSFRKLKQYDSALFFLDSILQYAPRAHEKELLLRCILINTYLNKSNCYLELEQWDDAIQYLNKSYELFAETDDKNHYLIYNLYMANAYDGKGEYEKALGFIDRAISLSKETQHIEGEWQAVKLKTDILEKLKDCDEEVENLRYLLVLTDTLKNREKLEKIQEQKYQNEALIMERQYELQQQASHQKQLIIASLAVIMTMIAVFVVILFILNRKRLAAELALRNREITAKSMDKMQSNELLNDVIEKLSEMETHPEKNTLHSAIRDLKTLVDVDTKKDFDLHFVQMHPDFYQKLLTDFPKLTQNELRLCAFIKSNLSIKEIAAINGISAESVKTARKRLRKSLNLTGEDVSLLEFLAKY